MFYYSLRLMKITLLQNEFEAFILQLYAFINFRIKKDQKLQTGFRMPSPRQAEETLQSAGTTSESPCSPDVCQLATLVPAFTIISHYLLIDSVHGSKAHML